MAGSIKETVAYKYQLFNSMHCLRKVAEASRDLVPLNYRDTDADLLVMFWKSETRLFNELRKIVEDYEKKS